jgi:hypothetical protein
MAITQQDIIDVIPRVIYTSNHEWMKSSYDVLVMLRSVIYTGWPTSKLYKKVDELVKLSYLEKKETAYVFDRETLTYAIRVCDECNDLGYVFNFKDENDYKKYPCPECQKDRGELGKVIDAIKAYKKSPCEKTSKAIDEAMRDCTFCVSIERKVWGLIHSVVNKNRPLGYLSTFAEWNINDDLTSDDMCMACGGDGTIRILGKHGWEDVDCDMCLDLESDLPF